MGGIFHLKLNIAGVPIANKYCEGKVKSTLKRELKVIETIGKERKGNPANVDPVLCDRRLL